jgi:two-component system, NtrC family, response regulator AtoC
MVRRKILIADDEPLIRNFLKDTFKSKSYDITTAENGSIAIQHLKNDAYDFIITDMRMPINSGLDVLNYAKKHHPNSIVIIMTAFGSVEDAVEAMNKGAFNYIIKPFSPNTIETIIEKADEHLGIIQENAYLRQEIASSSPLIAKSPSMLELLRHLPKIAMSNASVFISGESGTGKEVIAKAIHKHSTRSNAAFIKVNCAAIPETLIESEFFGFEKGAFTGANAKKEGRFELAHNGTILLDEVTEIPLSLQPKLLRAVQEKEFERVGGVRPITVDIRIISTSNRNMMKTIASNNFRSDLFYRLNVVPIFIPPLRERQEDILPLANYFIKKFCADNHKKIKTLSQEAKNKLLSYNWPGNVRELGNIIERTIVMDRGEVIEKSHILLDQHQPSQEKKSFQQNLFDDNTITLPTGVSIAEIEKKLILETLKIENNNKTKTAEILGINIKTLRTKLNLYEKEKIKK